MKSTLIFALVLVCITFQAQSQDCNCDHTIQPTENGLDFNRNNSENVQPGDTVCMMAGVYKKWTAFFELHGTKEQPIVIINCGGQVDIQATTTGFDFFESNDIVITGTGDPENFYGIKITGGTFGMRLSNWTNNYQIDHIRIDGCSEHGLSLKNDPVCSDERTWRSSGLVNDYVIVHDNYLTNIGLEGFYIGDSHYHTTVTCAGGGDNAGTTVEEAPIIKAEIYNNIVDGTGNDGIQVGSVTGEALIYNNIVRNFGDTDATGQHRSGFQINPGTKAVMYSNTAIDGKGTAYFISGDGVEMYNNVCYNVKTAIEHYDKLTSDGSSYKFYNNTFLDIFESGIAVITNSATRASNLFQNNILHYRADAKDGAFAYAENQAWNVENRKNNVITTDISSLKLKNLEQEEFGPTVDSDLILDLGDCSLETDMISDFDGYVRSYGNGCDIGAYEYTVASLEASESALDFGKVEDPTNTENLSYTLIGSNLREEISITMPTNYLLSTDPNNFKDLETLIIPLGENRSVNTTIYIKFTPKTGGVMNEEIIHKSSEHDDIVISISGELLTTLSIDQETLEFNRFLLDISDAQTLSYNLIAQNLLSDITIPLPENFLISTDPNNFSVEGNSLVLAKDENNAVETTIYVKFDPAIEIKTEEDLEHQTQGLSPTVVKLVGEAIVLGTETEDQEKLKIYPNPMISGQNTILTLEISKQFSGYKEMIVLDATGRPIMKHGFSDKHTSFKVNNKFSPGIYFIQVSNSKKEIATKKIFIL